MLANRQLQPITPTKGEKKVYTFDVASKIKSYSCPYVKTEEYCAKVLRHLLCFKNILLRKWGKSAGI